MNDELNDEMTRRMAAAGGMALALIAWFAVCLLAGDAPGLVVQLVGYPAADLIPWALVPATLAFGLSPALHFGAAWLDKREVARQERQRSEDVVAEVRHQRLKVALLKVQQHALTVAAGFAVVARLMAFVLVFRAFVNDASALGALFRLSYEPLVFVAQVVLLAVVLSVALVVAARSGAPWWSYLVIAAVWIVVPSQALGIPELALGAALALLAATVAGLWSRDEDLGGNIPLFITRASLSLLGRLAGGLGLVLLSLIAWIAYGISGLRAALLDHKDAVIDILSRGRLAEFLLARADSLHALWSDGPGRVFERNVWGAYADKPISGPRYVWIDPIRVSRKTRLIQPAPGAAPGGGIPPSMRAAMGAAMGGDAEPAGPKRPRGPIIELLALEVKGWPKKVADPEDAELRDICTGAMRFISDYLSGNLGPNMRQFEARISHAWVDPISLDRKLVIKAEPAAARQLLGKLAHGATNGDLITEVDQTTRYTARQLKELLLIGDDSMADDPRLANDVGGLYVRVGSRSGPAVSEPMPEPESAFESSGDRVRDAVAKALIEVGEGSDRFRFIEKRESYMEVIYAFALTLRSKGGQFSANTADMQSARELWKSLADAVAYHGGISGKTELTYDFESQEYRLKLALPEPAFPGDEAGDDRTNLVKFLRAHGDQMRNGRHPKRVAIGLDYQGRPLWLDYDEAPHVIVSGTTKTGKSVTGVIAPLIQLAYINAPDAAPGQAAVHFWLVDQKQELHRYFGRLPHTKRGRLVKPETIADVEPVLNDLDAEIMRRKKAYAGDDWSPRTDDAFIICVIEEWLLMISNAIAAKQDDIAKRVAARVGGVMAAGRSVGVHVIVATQRPTAECLPPNMMTNAQTRMVGVNSDPERRVLFGESADLNKTRVPMGKRGRMAITGPGVVDHEDDFTVIQGLWSKADGKPPADIKVLLDEIAAGYPDMEQATGSRSNGDPDGTAENGWSQPRPSGGYTTSGRRPGASTPDAASEPERQPETNSTSADESNDVWPHRAPSRDEIRDHSTESAVRVAWLYLKRRYDAGLSDFPVIDREVLANEARLHGLTISSEVAHTMLSALKRLGVTLVDPAHRQRHLLNAQIGWPVVLAMATTMDRAMAGDLDRDPDSDDEDDQAA